MSKFGDGLNIEFVRAVKKVKLPSRLQRWMWKNLRWKKDGTHHPGM